MAAQRARRRVSRGPSLGVAIKVAAGALRAWRVASPSRASASVQPRLAAEQGMPSAAANFESPRPGNGAGAVVGPQNCGYSRSATVPSGQSNPQLVSRNRPWWGRWSVDGMQGVSQSA